LALRKALQEEREKDKQLEKTIREKDEELKKRRRPRGIDSDEEEILADMIEDENSDDDYDDDEEEDDGRGPDLRRARRRGRSAISGG
jgi:hypothetical protein